MSEELPNDESPKDEDSMEDPIIGSQLEDTPTLTPYRKDFDQVDKMLSRAIKLSEDSRVHEPTCPICCSPIRSEAEDLYNQNPRNTVPIKQLLREKGGIETNAEVISHHMKSHKESSNELRKIEFIDDVRRLYSSDTTTLDEIKLCLSIITNQIMNVNSIGESHDSSEADIVKMKATETNKLMTTYKNFIQLRANILGEMKDNGEIISIPTAKFIDVFNVALSESKSEREREVVTKILNGLRGG